MRYILESARLVSAMGGTRIVVHPGGLGGLARRDAAALAARTLRRAQEALDGEGLSHVHICPETMGKIQQLGDLDEVLFFCGAEERFLPCIDFGHLNARTLGGLSGKADFAAVLDAVRDRLGEERGRCFHAHFSRIEFSKGGEKRHLTFAEPLGFGPEPGPLMELVAERASRRSSSASRPEPRLRTRPRCGTSGGPRAARKWEDFRPATNGCRGWKPELVASVAVIGYTRAITPKRSFDR